MSLIIDFVIEKKEGWFIMNDIEGIFHVNLETGICHCVSDVLRESRSTFTERIVKSGDFIFVLPIGRKRTIDIYSISKKKLIQKKEVDVVENCYIDNAIAYSGFMFLINNWNTDPSIIIFDIKNFNIVKKIPIDKDRLWKSSKEGRIFSKDIVLKENTLILASTSSCNIIKINLNNYSVEYVYIECSLSGFVTMCSNNGNYWFTDENAQLIKWNSKHVEQEYDLKKIFNLDMDLLEAFDFELKEYPGYKNSYMYFNSVIYNNGNILLIPGRANAVLKLDTFSNEWSFVYYRPNIKGETSWLLHPVLEMGDIYFCSVREQQLLKLDTRGTKVEKIPLKFEIKDKLIVIESGICSEDKRFPYTINDFINNDYMISNCDNTNEYGKAIY